jgi:hypothetical protein
MKAAMRIFNCPTTGSSLNVFQANAAKNALDGAQNTTPELDPNLRFFTSRRVIIVASKGWKSL